MHASKLWLRQQSFGCAHVSIVIYMAINTKQNSRNMTANGKLFTSSDFLEEVTVHSAHIDEKPHDIFNYFTAELPGL